MELPSALHFVFKHNEMMFAVLLALSLATMIILLLRGLGSSEGEELGIRSRGDRADRLDVEALEGTLKRVLAQVPVTVSGVVPRHSPADGASAPLAGSQDVLAAVTQATSAAAPAARGEGSSVSTAAAEAALRAQIRELEARLAEYAIIEDDIADLSLYKEENQRMKSELDDLRKRAGSGEPPAATAAGASSDGDQGAGEDDVMKDYLATVADGAAPKLGDNVSTSLPAAAAAPVAKSGPVSQADLDALPNEALVEDETAGAQQPEDPMAAFEAAASADSGADEGDLEALAADASTETQGAKVESAAADSEDPFNDPSLLAAMDELEVTPPDAAPDSDAESSIDSLADLSSPTPSPIVKSADLQSTSEAEAHTSSEDLDDPLGGTLDTSKMLDEVAGLANAPLDSSDDALEETLDTDKLLLEVDALDPHAVAPEPEPEPEPEPVAKSVPAPVAKAAPVPPPPAPLVAVAPKRAPAPPAPAPVQPEPPPAPQRSIPNISAFPDEADPVPEDDLFGEFMDEEKKRA